VSGHLVDPDESLVTEVSLAAVYLYPGQPFTLDSAAASGGFEQRVGGRGRVQQLRSNALERL
jgi:hypothetical protein